jgi:hypothetical protein
LSWKARSHNFVVKSESPKSSSQRPPTFRLYRHYDFVTHL